MCVWGTNGKNELGFSWDGLTHEIDIALQKHCFTKKGGNCSFSHSKHFSRCPPAQCSTYPAPVCRRFGFRVLRQCQRTALLQSDTEVWFGRGCVASSLFPESRTARTKAATSRAILHQPVPSKLFTTVVLSVSHSEKNFLHHRRLTRSITIRHFHRAGHVFFTTSRLQFLTLNRSLLLEVVVTPSFSLRLSIMLSY